MKTICVRVPENLLRTIDSLVEKGVFESRSDFVRRALRYFIKRNSWRRFR
ncbi:MAG: transcriptional regulator [Thermoprotei archaeon]|nr:MAG: transcriptional regulator [Thermoprotei archaeon]RLE98474.1 MAG: transcriptional regulator [Thermoprotei archaeon]